MLNIIQKNVLNIISAISREYCAEHISKLSFDIIFNSCLLILSLYDDLEVDDDEE